MTLTLTELDKEVGRLTKGGPLGDETSASICRHVESIMFNGAGAFLKDAAPDCQPLRIEGMVMSDLEGVPPVSHTASEYLVYPVPERLLQVKLVELKPEGAGRAALTPVSGGSSPDVSEGVYFPRGNLVYVPTDADFTNDLSLAPKIYFTYWARFESLASEGGANIVAERYPELYIEGYAAFVFSRSRLNDEALKHWSFFCRTIGVLNETAGEGALLTPGAEMIFDEGFPGGG